MTRTAVAPEQLARVYREITVDAPVIDVEARTATLAFASEFVVARWYGNELLDLNPSSVRLGRLAGGKHPLLMDHNGRDQVGVVERVWIDADRIARAVVRFGKSARAEEIFQDVIDGIRGLVSVGYFVHSMILDSRDGDVETYRVMDWEPFEISFVSVPADPTVGIGRESEQSVAVLRSLITTAKEDHTMKQRHRLQNQAGAEGGAGGNTPAAAPAPAPRVELVDTVAAARDATTAERLRAREIRALGAKFNQGEAAERAVDDGTPYDAFREQVFGRLEQSGALRVAEPATVGLSEREARSFRVTNLILAAMFPHDASVQRMAGFELEVSRAAQDKRENVAKERQGAFTIPVDVLARPLVMREADAKIAADMMLARMAIGGAGLIGTRDLSVGTTTAGGHTVATNLLASSFIELLTNAMVVMGLGPTVLPDLVGNLAIPRQTGGSTGYWVAEAGAATESQQAFDQVSLTPKTVGAFTDYSRRLLLQSSIAVEAFVRMDIARTLALAIDLGAINGSGASNQPRGVLQTVGIGSVAGGTNGAAPTWDHVVDLESAVANANADVGRLGYLSNTKVRGKLKKTQQFSGTSGAPVWQGNELNGYRAAVSNQVPSNLTKGTASGICSAIAFGNWADLIIGMWGGLDVMMDPYTGATSGTKRVVALQDVDVSVRHVESFAAMLDALTT